MTRWALLHFRRWSDLAILPLLPLLASCGETAPAGWAGTVDTLANGAVVIHNPAEGLWGPGEGWTVREELRIGSAMDEGPALFGQVAGVAVDDEGRIHVLDRQAKELRTFGPDGRHIRTVGREGGGPGEFRDPIGLVLSPDDRLWVVDARNARYAVFGLDGEHQTAHRRSLSGYVMPWNGGFGREGRFHEKSVYSDSRGFHHVVIRMDSALQPADTLRFPSHDEDQLEIVTESSRMTASVPFASSQQRVWDPRGFLWSVITGDYTLTQISPDGDTLRVIRRRGVEPIPVTATERADAIEGLEWFTRQGGRLDPSRIPSRKPPISALHVADDGHLWVRLTAAPDEEGARYDVFDPEGRYLGEVRSETSLGSARNFRGDVMYGVVSDSLGVGYVVRWALDRGGERPRD